MSASTAVPTQILIISPEPWDGHFVSKHHYAVTLASRGHRVFFLDPPDAALPGIRVKPTIYPNLWSVSAPRVAKGLRFYPAALRRWREARWLAKLEATVGGSFSAVWLFENSRFFDMRFAGNRLKVYHQVDLNQNFHVPDAAASADICFCTTDYIRQELLPHNARVYKIHHAVAAFEEHLELSSEQRAYFAEDKVNAAYVGNLKMAYLDVELLSGTVRRFPEVMFHFVGTCRGDEPLYAACKDLENIRWWGRVESRFIPAILSRCDVLLLTYKKAHYHDQASPHKVMEYLDSGKVVVATYTDEYKDKRNLLEMVYEPDDFFAAFERVTADLAYYNSPQRQRARTAFAKENTYPQQLNAILTHLLQHGLHL